MFSKQYQFGGKVFRLEAPVPIAEALHSELFRADGLPVDVTITASLSDTMPDGALLRTERAANHAFLTYAAAQEVSGGIRLTLLSNYENALTCHHMLQYAGFSHLLLQNGLCILHAACILLDGEAILFSAPSGTGKSTQADLWAKHRGVKIVNGDRVLLRSDGTAHGVYFSGESPYCEPFCAPIRAIVCLTQAAKSSISRIVATEALRALYSQCSFDLHNAEEVSNTIDLLMRLIPRILIYRLNATADISAVEVLENALREEK